MERPGLLEFAVYALLLAAAVSWVYVLPPFTRGPVSWQAADVAPTAELSTAVSVQEPAPNISREVTAPAPARPASEARADASSRSDEPARQPNRLVVTARSLNMRAEPNAGSDLVGSYPRGALVEEVETSGNWVLVRTEDQATGWMYIGYLGAAGEN